MIFGWRKRSTTFAAPRTTRALPATTAQPRSLASSSSRDITIKPSAVGSLVDIEDTNLPNEVWKAIALTVISTLTAGTLAVASGDNRLANAGGAIASTVLTAAIVDVLRQKRRFDVLALIDKGNDKDTKQALLKALAKRAMRLQEQGILGVDLPPELPPSALEPFTPEFEPAIAEPAAQPRMASAPVAAYEPPAIAPQATAIVDTAPAQMSLVTTPSTPPNWLKEAVERVDEKGRPYYPHYNLAGTTGDGKTTTADFIARTFLEAHNAEPYLINPKHKQHDPEWSFEPECTDIEDVMSHLNRCLADMNQRRQVKTPGTRLIIIDEIDWIINTCGSDAKKAVQSLFKVGRSVGINLVLCGQSPLASDTGFTGADFRNFYRLILASEAIPFLSNPQFPYSNMRDVLSGKAQEVQTSTRYWGLVLPKGDRPCIKAMPYLEQPSQILYPKKSGAPLRPPHPQPTTPPAISRPAHQTLALAPVQRQETQEMPMLPSVQRHELAFEGMETVVITEPPIIKLLNERDDLRAIVRALIDWGGSAEARLVQSGRQCKALRFSSGAPYNTQAISHLMDGLADLYPDHFAFDGKTLTAKDPDILQWELKK